MFKLTEKALKYGWADLKKRTGCFSLEFNDNGNYIGFETSYKVKFPVEDIIRFKEDAIKWLLDNGYIALTEKR